MGLKETIQSAALTAVKAVGNIAEDVDYTQQSDSDNTYDVTTGTVTQVNLVRENVTCIFTEYESREVDGQNIKPTDNKVLIPHLELPFRPRQGDLITRKSGEIWRVMDAQIDPADALWQVQCRIKDNAPLS